MWSRKEEVALGLLVHHFPKVYKIVGGSAINMFIIYIHREEVSSAR